MHRSLAVLGHNRCRTASARCVWDYTSALPSRGDFRPCLSQLEGRITTTEICFHFVNRYTTTHPAPKVK